MRTRQAHSLNPLISLGFSHIVIILLCSETMLRLADSLRNNLRLSACVGNILSGRSRIT